MTGKSFFAYYNIYNFLHQEVKNCVPLLFKETAKKYVSLNFYLFLFSILFIEKFFILENIILYKPFKQLILHDIFVFSIYFLEFQFSLLYIPYFYYLDDYIQLLEKKMNIYPHFFLFCNCVQTVLYGKFVSQQQKHLLLLQPMKIFQNLSLNFFICYLLGRILISKETFTKIECMVVSCR